VAAPLSKSQIERLGQRLVHADAPAETDLLVLRELLLERSNLLELAIARVRDQLRLAPTSRIKNTGTILEKLRRNGGSGLKSMQDLGGMRIVGPFDRDGQDVVVQRVCALFAGEVRAPKVIDRRIEPMHGYAAVHVIVFPDDAPIEIQIRTEWQHEWAELFEKLADRVGRGIRYGEPPLKRWTPEDSEGWTAGEWEYAHVSYEVRLTLVRLALSVAAMIDAAEEGESLAPGNPKLDAYRRKVDESLDHFRQVVEREDVF
jgi:Region found in RelA / SpoT proteins